MLSLIQVGNSVEQRPSSWNGEQRLLEPARTARRLSRLFAILYVPACAPPPAALFRDQSPVAASLQLRGSRGDTPNEPKQSPGTVANPRQAISQSCLDDHRTTKASASSRSPTVLLCGTRNSTRWRVAHVQLRERKRDNVFWPVLHMYNVPRAVPGTARPIIDRPQERRGGFAATQQIARSAPATEKASPRSAQA